MAFGRLLDAMDSGDRNAFGRRVSLTGICCNVLLVAAKGTAGVMSGSISMIADAVNNLMDATSSVVSLVGFKIAGKPADEGHPYGHGRSEYLAGLAVAVLVLFAGFELIRESVARIIMPEPTHYSVVSIAILAASIIVKLLLSRFYREAGNRIDSGTLLAASVDSRNDVVATTTVLGGALVSRFTGIQVDGFLGALVGLFVIASGIELLKDTANPLLGNKPDSELVERVRGRILSHPEVIDAHDLLIHDYGPGRKFASAHVEMAAERDPIATHDIIDRIERELRKEEGLATILHYDPIVTDTKHGDDLRAKLAEAACRVDGRLTIHDLHVRHSAKGTVLCFDCVRPNDLELDDAALTEAITREVATVVPDAICHVTYDDGFASPAH